MHIGIMLTNGGTHPPEKWAVVTAGQIIQIGDNPSINAVAARRMELNILNILEEAHGAVQDAEKLAIATKGSDHLDINIDPTPFIEKPLNAIIAVSKGTPFEAHFANPRIADYLRTLLGQHFGTAMHIERNTFADKIPDHPSAKSYVARYGQNSVRDAVREMVVQASAQI